ncbi:hypothetical protein INR49_027929 [Caranx melampygus]|nr:hypothetical protein INR49_027929 [Caranx melampygus]
MEELKCPKNEQKTRVTRVDFYSFLFNPRAVRDEDNTLTSDLPTDTTSTEAAKACLESVSVVKEKAWTSPLEKDSAQTPEREGEKNKRTTLEKMPTTREGKELYSRLERRYDCAEMQDQ